MSCVGLERERARDPPLPIGVVVASLPPSRQNSSGAHVDEQCAASKFDRTRRRRRFGRRERRAAAVALHFQRMRLFATSWIRTGIATAVFVASAGGCQVLVTLDTSPGPDAAVDASTSEASPLPRVPNACDERTLVRPTAPSGGAALIELVFGYVSLDTEPPATA